MADAQTTIELIFQGVDKTGAATQSVISGTKSIAQNLESATAPIADFTASAVKVEAAVLAAGVAMTAFAVKAAGDFDGAFREISTLINVPIEDLGEFRDAILNYAQTSTQPLESITGAIYSAISAGVDYGDSIEAIAVAEQLAVAGKADLNDSLVVLVSSLNAYGLGMDDAERFSDALFNTVKLGQTTLPELSAGLADVTGTAATLEVPFETLLASLAALTSTGTPTTKAITQINAVLAALLGPTPKAAAEAEKLGIEFSAQAVKAKGLEQVLQEVYTATGGNEESMKALFGSVEALRAVFPLTGLAAQTFTDNIDEMNSSAGVTAEAFDKMADDIGLVAQKMTNAFNVMLVNIGDPLLDEFSNIADGIAAIFAAIGNAAADGPLQSLVAFIETQMQGLGDAIAQVAANLPAALEQADLSGFQNGVQSIIDAFGDLFDEIDISTVDGLTRAIEFAGKAFESLSKFTAGVITSFGPLFDYIVDLADDFEGLDSSVFEAAGEFGGFAIQLNKIAGGISGILPVFEALLGVLVVKQGIGVVGALTSLAGSAGSAATGLALTAAKAAPLVAAAGAAGAGIGTLVSNGLDALIGAATDAEHSLGTLIFEMIDGGDQAELLGESVSKIPEALDEIEGVEIHDLSEDFEAIQNAAEGASGEVESVADVITAALAAAQDSSSLAEFANTSEGMAAAAANLIPEIDDATGKIIGFRQGSADSINILKELQGVTGFFEQDTKNLAVSLGEAAAATEEFNEKAQEMEHEERLARIAAASDIATARIKANADIIQSAFQSIDNTISDTGDLLGDLFGLFDADLNFREQFAVADQIELENERRGDALELQKRLTEATIAQMRAQTKALESGDGLITIQGDGLAPHLEAFMWEVLKAIQVRVNQDGLEQLLGTQGA